MVQVDEFGLAITPTCTEMATSDVVCCVHSSDEVTDFFVSNGLGACQDLVCTWMGIESAEDLKLISEDDVRGPRFSDWASGSLTMVQHKKVLKAFSSTASA